MTLSLDELRARTGSAGREHRLARLTFAPNERSHDGPLRLAGHAAVFNSTSEDLGFRERLLPGCFRAALGRPSCDVFLLWQHDHSQPLARQSAGSLTVREDTRGLWFEAELPATSTAQDALELVRAGVIDGMSFGFTMAGGQDRWTRENGEPLREIVEIGELIELSLVSWPAYTATDVGDRDRELVQLRARADQAAAKARGRLSARARSPYGPESPHSYFRDLVVEAEADGAIRRAQDSGLARVLNLDAFVAGAGTVGGAETNRDQGTPADALQRLRALRDSAEVRDITTGAVAALTSVSGAPSFVAEAVATAVRARAALAAALPNGPLPEHGMDVITGGFTTAASVGMQATENAAASEADAASTNRTSPVGLALGQVDVSRQALERSASGRLDEALARELGAALATLLDDQIIRGSGTSGQTKGLLNWSGISTVTYTDGTPTFAELLEAVWKLASTVAVAYGGPVELVSLHPRRIAWAEGKAAAGTMPPRLPGVRTIVAGTIPTNIGGGTNEDIVLALAGIEQGDLRVLTGRAIVQAFEQVGASTAPATVRVTIRQYLAMLVSQPAAVGYLTGTGLNPVL